MGDPGATNAKCPLPPPSAMQELSGVQALLKQGDAKMDDLEALHATALAAGEGTAGADFTATLGSTQLLPPLPLAPTHPLVQLLARRPLGEALLTRCVPLAAGPLATMGGAAGLDASLSSRTYGPRFLLDGAAAARLLGPGLGTSATTVSLASAMDQASYM